MIRLRSLKGPARTDRCSCTGGSVRISTAPCHPRTLLAGLGWSGLARGAAAQLGEPSEWPRCAHLRAVGRTPGQPVQTTGQDLFAGSEHVTGWQAAQRRFRVSAVTAVVEALD